jgi:hypothetical protein
LAGQPHALTAPAVPQPGALGTTRRLASSRVGRCGEGCRTHPYRGTLPLTGYFTPDGALYPWRGTLPRAGHIGSLAGWHRPSCL